MEGACARVCFGSGARPRCIDIDTDSKYSMSTPCRDSFEARSVRLQSVSSLT